MTDSAASTDDLWTVQRILQWTTDYLGGRGVESPRLEAELLLAHARNCRRINLYAEFDVELTDAERSVMRDFVKRRASREPLAYITGHREFYGRDFQVGPGVLVPRPETETLVDVCLERIPENSRSTVCEVGFGSGCVAVTLAKQRAATTIVATDISEAAYEFATLNVAAHKVAPQVELRVGDAFAPLGTEFDQSLDGIVSNPPYVRCDELSALAPEVSVHEPGNALVSGQDGLDLIRQLIEQSKRYLKPGGWIALEFDPAQADTVRQLLAAASYSDIKVLKDLSGDDRVAVATAPA